VEELQVYVPYISACNNERIVKIDAELPKLFQKIKLGIRFLDHPVYYSINVLV